MSRGFVAAALRLLGMTGRFVLLVLIGRTLTPEDFGAYGLFAVTSAILTLVVGLELHQPAVREILKRADTARGDVVRTQLRTYAFAYLLLPPALGGAILLDIVSPLHALLLGLVIVGSHLSLESQRLLIAAQRTERAFLAMSLAQGLWVFPLAAVMLLVPGLRSLTIVLGAWAAASLIAAAIGFHGVYAIGWLRRQSGAGFDAAFLRDAWPSALLFMASTTTFVVIESLDRYFLEHFHGHAAVGVYTLYAGFARALRELAFAAIVSTSLPIFVGARQRNELAGARHELVRMARRLTVYVLVGAPLLAAGLFAVLPFLNDARYAENVPTFLLLLFATALSTFAMISHYALYAAGRERTILTIHAASLVVAIVAYSILIPSYGVHGAALATMVVAAVMTGLKWFFARGELRGAADA